MLAKLNRVETSNKTGLENNKNNIDIENTKWHIENINLNYINSLNLTRKVNIKMWKNERTRHN